MELFDSLKEKIKTKKQTLVFPEGEDERIVGATVRLAADGLVNPIVLGNPAQVEKLAQDHNWNLDGVQVIDPKAEVDDAMRQSLLERRNGKNTAEQVAKMLEDPNYVGTMLVYMGRADGMVSGANHPTGDTVRPALQIIKTKPGVKRISGAFIMQKGDERYVFADCAINIELDAAAWPKLGLKVLIPLKSLVLILRLRC